MKVAFDVQGTLLGFNRDSVVALFKWFESKGCMMHVWSYGGTGMARDAARECGLAAITMGKISKSFYDEDGELAMDICVDDEEAAKADLSARHVILVREIPRRPEQLQEYFATLEQRFFKEGQ